MKIKYYFGISGKLGALYGELYKPYDGVLFDRTEKVDLHIYLGNFGEVIIVPGNRLRIGGASINVQSKMVEYTDFKEVDLPYSLGGDIRYISYADERYVTFYEGNYWDKNGLIIIDMQEKREVRLPVAGYLHVDCQYILIRKLDLILCFDWVANELWQYNLVWCNKQCSHI